MRLFWKILWKSLLTVYVVSVPVAMVFSTIGNQTAQNVLGLDLAILGLFLIAILVGLIWTEL